jgi:hypothetical protein
MTTSMHEYQVSLGNGIWVGIRDNYGATDQRKTRQVIDIIAQIHNMLRINVSLFQKGSQDCLLIPNSLYGSQLQLTAACGNNRVGLRREYYHRDACLAQHGNPESIATIGNHRFVTILVYPDAIISHDTIKIKDQQVNLFG